ncbi:MAG: Ig-like domain repeat protein [Kofleriaceae bacterium]
MPSSLVTLGRGLVAACAVAGALAGCGDGPICQSEKLVFIQSPQGPIIADTNPNLDGVQADVVVKSTFGGDAEVVLTVADGAGQMMATLTGTTDRDGNVTFADVTIPAGGATLRAAADAGVCGSDSDEVTVSVLGGGDCAVDFVTAPVDNPFYAPLQVWNAAADSDAATPGFQGDVIVRARAGEQAKLFLSAPGVPEMEIGAGAIGDTGEARLPISAPEGQVNLRAECGVAASVGSRSSSVTSVFVDTVAPTCAMVAPTPGTSITPGLDANGDLSDGIQLTLRGGVTGGDTAGEAANFVVTDPAGNPTTLTGSPIASDESTADASFAPATSPAMYAVRFEAADHAGNTCAVDQPYRVVLAGCTLEILAPTAVVTVDADGDGSNGAQVDIDVSSPACAGLTVTSDCGLDSPATTLDAGGAGTLRATVCAGVPCEASQLCTLSVTSTDGIQTTAGLDLRFDNQGPSVAVAVAQPGGIGCGGTVTPAQDLDAATPGVQIRMRVTAPNSVSRSLDQTSSAGTTTIPVTSPINEEIVTLAAGANSFVGRATDAAGNTGASTACAVTLSDLAVNFTGSPADGLVGAADGTVAGATLTFPLTGTVSTTGATVAVTVDGGAPQAATVTGTSFTLNLALAARATPYVIVATATQGPRVGSATLSLTVDLTPPVAPAGLTAIADTRQSIRLNFTSGGGAASYLVKFSTSALTDANFATTGTAVTGPTPGAAGAAEVARARPLRAGAPYWVGVAAVDAAGNRSVAQIAGPLTPRFDQAAVVGAPNTTGDASFGLAMVKGRFNDDDFDDVAVGAPYVTSGGLAAAGEVYVYLGSAVGLATAPALTLRGVAVDENFGSSLAAVRWSSGTRDDLVIGAPGADGFSGAVYVVNGGAALPTGAVAASVAQRRISVLPTANWFTGSAFGWQVASGDHDGDGQDDLIATAIFGNGGASGAAVVLYGGTVPTGNVRISDVSAAGSGAAVMRMYEDPDATGSLFGFYLTAVGPTTGTADTTDDLVVGYAEDGLPNATVLLYRGIGRPAAPGVTRAAFTAGRDVRIREVTIDTVLEFGSAVGSIDDQNGDGARDLVFGDYRYLGDNGRVMIISGASVGTAGTALTSTPGVLLADWVGPNNNDHLGMAIVNNGETGTADVDGDGAEDLVVATRNPGTTQGVLAVWFGPVPLTSGAPAPNHVITGPAGFSGPVPAIGGSPIAAIWAGDVNADGLDDICWADWTSNGRDGSLQMLWDDGM